MGETEKPGPGLPRWRGFNLQEMYWAGGPQAWREDDFRFIREFGFDFVRLPLNCRHWMVDGNPLVAREEDLARLDRAVALGRQHGLHVCLNLHYAPGYSVNFRSRRGFNLWRDPPAQEAFCRLWRVLSDRYRDIEPAALSFDLVNEPPFLFTRGLTPGRYRRVMRRAVETIRAAGDTRWLILNGVNMARRPCPGLEDLPRVAFSCRAYDPIELTHHRAEWVWLRYRRRPVWPGMPDLFGRRWDRRRLERSLRPWLELARRGTGVHCGETGCCRHTPHEVYLAWLRDVLEILGGAGIGWALWNFRGAFGVLDSGRDDVRYEPFYGHRLDRRLLELLQAF